MMFNYGNFQIMESDVLESAKYDSWRLRFNFFPAIIKPTDGVI